MGKSYSNIGGVAKNNTAIYGVVGGVTKAMKKAYAVVGGVAKLVWNAIASVSTKYKGNSSDGSISALSKARYYLTATNIANSYVIFANGAYNYSSSYYCSDATEAYNTSLTQTVVNEHAGSSVSGKWSASASVGNYALVTGGYNKSTGTCISRTKSINTSLTRSNAGYITNAAEGVTGGSIGSYAIFIGGKDADGNYVENGDVYNSSLTQTTTTTWAYSKMASANVGNYCLFAGGYDSSGANSYARVYDSSVSYQGIWTLGFSTYFLAGASTTNHAIFAGGGTSAGTAVANVSAFDSSLTRTTLTPLAIETHALAGTSLDGVAIFAGGGSRIGGNGDSYATTYCYDDSLTQVLGESLSQARDSLAAASVGKYAFFGGGCVGGSTHSNRVDVYTF